MKKQRIFISSVQNEFKIERKTLTAYLRNDPLMGDFFDPFIFEEVPANTYTPGKVYINEVKESDIYIGLLGAEYGYEDEQGISPTEREYNKAKEEGFKVTIWRPAAVTDQATDHNTIPDAAQDTIQNKTAYREIPDLTHRLVLIISGEMSRQELMNKLELKHNTNFRNNYLKPAQEEGLIEMLNPDKPTIESQKYRLTRKGKNLQKRIRNELK